MKVATVKFGGVVLPVPAESTSNWKVFDVPPPGAGDFTVTGVIPALEKSAAGTWTVRTVELVY